MKSIQMTVRDGHWVSVEPAGVPEGTVARFPVEDPRFSIGMAEEDWPQTPEEIAEWIRELDAIPPLVLTPEEEADLLLWRQKSKEFNLEAVRRQMTEGI